MFRKLNRAIKGFLREKRLKLGKFLWDRKEKKENIVLENFIEKNKINSILFLRYDGKIGDMIINTLMFREIKKRYPNVKIGVVARGNNKDIIENNKNVKKIYIYEKKRSKIKKLAKEIEKEKYDLLVDFSEMLRVNSMMFIKLCNCRFNIGLDKKGWNLFDLSVNSNEDFKWTDHITERYSAYLRKIGIKGDIDLAYDIMYEDIDISKIRENYEKIVILNPYGASKHKTFSLVTLKKIIEYLKKYSIRIVVLYYGDKYKELEELKAYENVYIPEKITTIKDSINLIAISDLVITPDTSIVHIASALNKRNISVYPPNGGNYGVDHIVWAPLTKGTNVIFCKDKKSKYDEIDINTFNFDEMKDKIDLLIEEINNEK